MFFYRLLSQFDNNFPEGNEKILDVSQGRLRLFLELFAENARDGTIIHHTPRRTRLKEPSDRSVLPFLFEMSHAIESIIQPSRGRAR